MKIAIYSAFLIAVTVAVPAAGEFYVGEKVKVAPLELTVENPKYSQGKRFDKPGQDNLFLICDLRLRNSGSTAVPLRVRDAVTILALGDTVRLDTMRNFAAVKVREIAGDTETTVPVKFVVPREAHNDGAILLFQFGGVRARVNLKFINAFDGHLAAGIDQTDREQYGEAMREFKAALACAQTRNNDDRCYTLYRIGELYTRMFLYEEAVERFGKLAESCPGTDAAAEAAGHVTALRERIDAETSKARASRLVECGYAYAFQLADHERALALFTEIKSGYASHTIGEFTAGQVADLYTINVRMNLKQYAQAALLCVEALKGAGGTYAGQLTKMQQQIRAARAEGE